MKDTNIGEFGIGELVDFIKEVSEEEAVDYVYSEIKRIKLLAYQSGYSDGLRQGQKFADK